ncbi:insulinase family protein [Shewanella eurypsychrophilus]|uniref:Insulinase family protein n=1 Tax=Shewanella eurypsychrophilus TaxID=2593656 RepID=A0ABX6VA48_9GAMM|nr:MULTISPECIES: insulinase family protein [Shewanella]QFU24331.1 insulinase family protein [Shewanella sp. YLB-09]QPG59531.2 insulinase family protein [Shewanella eurypsychrophilus]
MIFLKPPKVKTLSLFPLLSIMVLMLGCQQTKLVFTDKKEPVTPVFNQLEGAPQVQSSVELASHSDIESWTPETLSISAEFSLHLFPKSPSELNYVELVLINPNKPFNNIDILSAALNERALWLADQYPISCIESLGVNARMHSISLKMACPAHEVPQALNILANSWSHSAFEQIDLENIQRKLKLNKHINAYSGAEIDKVWARIILGKSHPYNQALDNQDLLNELNMASLSELQQKIGTGAKWHLFMSQPSSLQIPDAQDANLSKRNKLIQQATKLAKQLENRSSMVKEQNTTASTLPTSKEEVSDNGSDSQPYINTGKIIYLIDAPGAVQTQVRVGYRLPLSASDTDPLKSEISLSDPLNCQLLASWLGRSFSGRLYYDLREKRGLTYGIYGRCFDNPQARTLKFYGSTQLQHTGAFVSGILDHLQLTTEQGIGSQELEALKTYEKSKYALTMQSQHSMKTQYINQLSLGRNNKELIINQARIQKLDSVTLKEIAKLNFSSPPFIVLRGDADKIRQDLADKLPSWNIQTIEP